MSDSSSGAKSKRIPKSRAVPRILLSILQGLESPNKVTGFERREKSEGLPTDCAEHETLLLLPILMLPLIGVEGCARVAL